METNASYHIFDGLSRHTPPFKFALVNLAHWQDHSKLAPGYPEVSIDSFESLPCVTQL
jgi:hypothetical protein